ncbi:hypothetical protein NEIG_01076 [Nematocida sp. ERTm5]|nr:hypothetical protein NEIG_01076 [Nematocida sp. ERTm5]
MSAQSVLWHILGLFRKGRNTKISEITEALQISRKECIDTLYLVAEQLDTMGYVLIPGSTTRTNSEGKVLAPEDTTVQYTQKAESLKKCDFVYIAKKKECTEDENQYITKYVSDIVYVYTVIYLNGCELQYERVLSALQQMGRSEEVMREMISKKYFYKKKKNEEYFIRPGWKFFMEFPDFSPEEYLAAMKSSCV